MRIILRFERETANKAVYSELVGDWFTNLVYLDKENVKKMYGGELPKFIRLDAILTGIQ